MAAHEQGHPSITNCLREKEWLKLLSSVQRTKSTKSDRVQLILQLLDMMYDSGIRVNAMHICAAVTVSFVSCPRVSRHVEQLYTRCKELYPTPLLALSKP